MSKLHFEGSHAAEEYEEKSKPSDNFLEAKIPFEYTFILPGGEKLEAFQDQAGEGSVIIKRGTEVVFDFKDLLPEGYKMVTPAYFLKYPEEKSLLDYLGDDWAQDPERKIILLGEFKKPQDVLFLLHEIGHSFDENTEGLERLSAMKDTAETTENSEEEVWTSEGVARLESKMERNAWAEALKLLRNIQRNTGIDLRSLFPAFADLKKYINEALATYRRKNEWIIKEGHDEEFYKELGKWFDKWQYEE